jgi:hypothetical protein
MGIPIITSANQNHGPEFSYLVNGYNSLIVSGALNMYVETINGFIAETKLQETLRFGLAQSLENFNIDIMVANYLAGIGVIMGKVHE